MVREEMNFLIKNMHFSFSTKYTHVFSNSLNEKHSIIRIKAMNKISVSIFKGKALRNKQKMEYK